MNARSTIFSSSLLMAVFGLAGLTVGCAPMTHVDKSGRSYCDANGCYTCDDEGTCTPVRNQKCDKDADCKGGLVCTNIGCAKPCAKDSQCAKGEACITGHCAPKGFSKTYPVGPSNACTKDSQCSSDTFCRAGACVPRCKSDDECGPNKVCTLCGKCQAKNVPATCGTQPTFCSAKAPCGGGKTCISARCHYTCNSSNSCPVGQTCQKGVCKDDPNPQVPECALDMDCGAGACINGYCHQACTNSEQCDKVSVCQMGICQPNYYPVQK